MWSVWAAAVVLCFFSNDLWPTGCLLYLHIILSLHTSFLLLPQLSMASAPYFSPMKINISQHSPQTHLSVRLPAVPEPEEPGADHIPGMLLSWPNRLWHWHQNSRCGRCRMCSAPDLGSKHPTASASCAFQHTRCWTWGADQEVCSSHVIIRMSMLQMKMKQVAQKHLRTRSTLHHYFFKVVWAGKSVSPEGVLHVQEQQQQMENVSMKALSGLSLNRVGFRDEETLRGFFPSLIAESSSAPSISEAVAQWSGAPKD